MAFDSPTLRRVFDKTDGLCHLCRKRLVFSNYGQPSGRGQWQVEHSMPRAKGGSDHLNNLYPACPECNRLKGVSTTASSRARHGHRLAPLSKDKAKKARSSNSALGTVLGGLMGLAGGPVGVGVGAWLGYTVGKAAEIQPK